MFLVFFLIPIFFTWWGWSRVLGPIGIPLVWTLWRIIYAIIITMVLIAPIGSGWWFRTYGYDLTDIVYMPLLSDEQWRGTRWRRENNIDLHGEYSPNWRKKQGMVQLPPEWNGHSEHSTNPIWSLTIPIGAIGGYLFLEKMYHGGKSTKRKKKIWRHRTGNLPSSEEQNDQLHRILARSAARRNKSFAVAMAFPPEPKPAAPTSDVQFTQALRNLGYKNDVIRDVATQCTEQDLEARVRHALQILARK